MAAVDPAQSSGGRDAGLLRAMIDRVDQQDPGAFNNLGVLYFSKGLYAEAVDAFLRALALDARMRTAARNLEVAAAQPGACDARLMALNVRLADHPRDRASRRDRARLLRLIGRHAEATQQLDALIEEDSDDAAALFERGLVEQRAGDLQRAQRWFERAVNVDAGHAVARLHFAEVLYQRGQNEQALRALDALVTLDPTMADAHLLRGFVLGDMGHHDAAMDASRQAAALNPSLQSLQPHLSLETTPEPATLGLSTAPERGLARYGLGLAFRQRGYFREARREFQRSIADGEDAQLSRHALAELDLIAGDFIAARQAYDALLREHRDHPRYWNEYGVAQHQGGAVSVAADCYRQALRFDPRYALAYNNLGVALDDAGDADGARDALLRAAEIDPSLVRARLNLAMWYQRHGDAMASMKLLRELVAFHPNDADAWHALGVACRHVKWIDEARGAFARAVEQRPTHAEARYALAEVLGALGDADGALRETQQALALSSVREASRLTVGIDLQRECPDACGALALLSVQSHEPLEGIALDAETVALLLPERDEVTADSPASAAVDAGVSATHDIDLVGDAMLACDAADDFATRGLLGEAFDRYAGARRSLDAPCGDPEHADYAVWRRAAIGEARSLCLLGRGAEPMALIKRLGTHDSRDVEVIALFACSAAALSRDGSVPQNEQTASAAAARTAVLRTLRLEPPSAALMHFVGDAALAIHDAGLALACYRRSLAMDPTRPSPRVAIARLLRRRGDLLAARLELVAALITANGWRDAVMELAQVHRDADRPHEALTLLMRHLAGTPTDLDALVVLAETLMRLDRDADARVAVTRVLRHDAQHPAALWVDGLLLARQSRMRDAVDRWRQVVSHDTESDLAEKAERAIAEAEVPVLQLVS